jgi:hypothetical protein
VWLAAGVNGCSGLSGCSGCRDAVGCACSMDEAAEVTVDEVDAPTSTGVESGELCE